MNKVPPKNNNSCDSKNAPKDKNTINIAEELSAGGGKPFVNKLKSPQKTKNN